MTQHEPPRAGGNRGMVDERLAEVRSQAGTAETVSIDWRGTRRNLDVIDMPVDVLYYNPETHRIKAQRTADPERDALLEEQPWSDEAQHYLHELLKGDPADPLQEDPRFGDLKRDLAANAQAEPGIITRSGILVNGNTRRAALRELGEPTIRVGVLPADAGWGDVGQVELALQLRRELKREYSFLNFLLAVDEFVSNGRPTADIARDFRVHGKTINRAKWILGFINDAIERSVSEVNGQETRLRLIDFERNQGQLEELARTYLALEPKDPTAAAKLREGRLLGVIFDFSKTDIRSIEGDFVETYLADELSPPDDREAASVSIPGLDVTVPPEDQGVAAIRALTDKVLQAKAIAAAASGATSIDVSRAADAANLTATLRAAALGGVEKAQAIARAAKKRQEAPERLSVAADIVDEAAKAVVSARVTGQLDSEALDSALIGLREALRRLADQVHRGTGEETGEGVEWLLASADERIGVA